ncbi:MAG TPA: hypothetical protein GXX39_05945 [Syntrophothermus lipocalidus]|uniref:RsgI N-terminal anti-sigma domain-containing protein n=1 Tax=Syntrophothermus lipocalidus (strain DSM 12680 / TGB-C1) TaxID=643648 RepID=D7CLE2_SYNLT|nr:hypothetical protein [Syntrophothermus lipocalidus]ADI01527.1 hypothetical protein Slip_0747 [Syntrophothermus lipocalidus DSM 12680]HHV76888.1 hypothetical protein [Syntrophothermus lipocalidus]
MAVIKGVVLESSESGAVILTRSGRFRRVRARKYLPDVGTEIQYREWGRDVVWYGVAVVVLFVLMLQIAAFLSPAVYMSIESGPGIKLGINRFGLVVNPVSTDENGARILNQVSVRGRDAGSALEALLNKSLAEGLIETPRHEVVLIAVPVNQTGDRLLRKLVPPLNGRLESWFAENGGSHTSVEICVTRKPDE